MKFDARRIQGWEGPIVVIAKKMNDRLRWAVPLLAAAWFVPTLSAQQFADDEAPPVIKDRVPGLVAAPARSQLEELLSRKIAYVEGISGLTDDQKKKLELAGHGDINHLLDRIEDLRTKAQSGRINVPFDDLGRENESLKRLLITGPFDKLSLFGKTQRRLLTAEQLTKLDADGKLFSSAWMADFGEAQDLSRQHNRPLLVHFHADWAAPCWQMKDVLHKPKVIQLLHDHFVPVFIDVDHEDAKRVMRQYGISSVPTDLILSPEGVVVGRSQGAKTEHAVVDLLQSIAGAARQPTQNPGTSGDQLPKDQPQPLTAPFDEGRAKAAQGAWAKSLGKSSPLEKNSIGMELVLIPPGKFLIGSPEDEKDRETNEGRVDVTLTTAFYLGKTEVTQAQWLAVMGTTPWRGHKSFKGDGAESMREGDAYPVTFVSWDDAQAFCRELSNKEKREFRLPTEAEWEYACRAGTTTRFSFGKEEVVRRQVGPNKVLLDDYAWWGKTLGDGVDEKMYEHEVGLKKPNPFGLFDMHGNVGEWCADWYATYPKAPQVDPIGPLTGSYRVYRGGDWFADNAKYCRSASRGWAAPSSRQFISCGFRVACSAAR